MEVVKLILQKLMSYLSSLDWAYMITLIAICYAMEREGVKEKMKLWTRIEIKKKYRVLLIGIFYGTLIYFLRGYTISHIEMLLQSFVFAMVFHKVLIEELEQMLQRSLNQFKNNSAQQKQRNERSNEQKVPEEKKKDEKKKDEIGSSEN